MTDWFPVADRGRPSGFRIPRSWWKRRPIAAPEPDPEVLEVVRHAHRKLIREYLERRRAS